MSFVLVEEAAAAVRLVRDRQVRLTLLNRIGPMSGATAIFVEHEVYLTHVISSVGDKRMHFDAADRLIVEIPLPAMWIVFLGGAFLAKRVPRTVRVRTIPCLFAVNEEFRSFNASAVIAPFVLEVKRPALYILPVKIVVNAQKVIGTFW